MTTVNFEFERKTPGTWRFKEKTAKGQPKNIGTLYLQNHLVEQLGEPEKVTVTVEAS